MRPHRASSRRSASDRTRGSGRGPVERGDDRPAPSRRDRARTAAAPPHPTPRTASSPRRSPHVVAQVVVRAVGEQVECGTGRIHDDAALHEPHVAPDRLAQHREHVGAGRGPVPRCELLGVAGAADERTTLEDHRAESGSRQVEARHQAVVAAADDHGIVRFARSQPFLQSVDGRQSTRPAPHAVKVQHAQDAPRVSHLAGYEGAPLRSDLHCGGAVAYARAPSALEGRDEAYGRVDRCSACTPGSTPGIVRGAAGPSRRPVHHVGAADARRAPAGRRVHADHQRGRADRRPARRLPVHRRARRDRRVRELGEPARGVREPRDGLSVGRPVERPRLASVPEPARRDRRRQLRGRRHRGLRVLLLLHDGHDRRGALVLHRRGVDRLAQGRHVDRDQRAHGPGDRDAAVRRAEPREQRPREGAQPGRDVPVRGLLPAPVTGVQLLRRHLHEGASRPRRVHGVGARRTMATATRRRTTSPRATCSTGGS